MPKRFSRITLEITDIRFERVQDISEEDVDAEGFGGDVPHLIMPDLFTEDDWKLDMVECFSVLWDSINGKKEGCSWADNPWVWVVEFEVIK